MRKSVKKLTLNRETVINLDSRNLQGVLGRSEELELGSQDYTKCTPSCGVSHCGSVCM
jgi:hypothetical protein